MKPQYVPISMGSPRFRSADVDGFRVTEAWFAAGDLLPPHRHDRTTFAVMLEGSFDVVFPGKALDCPPSTVLTEPLAERHGNRVGHRGARVLVIQPDPHRTELFHPCRALLEELRHFAHPGLTAMAWRLAGELRSDDDLAPLAMEGLGLEMLALAARLREETISGRRPPRWLRHARDEVQARFAERLHVADVASAVGVHPAHLARAFRARFGTPIGSYVRRLRLDHAAKRLGSSSDGIARIATEAGFADQSHFTRAFKRYAGVTPDRYRRSLRG